MKTIALIGTCGHQTAALDELMRLGGCRLAAVAPASPDDDVDALVRRNAFTSAAMVYSTPEALFAACEPDIVVVSPRLDLIAPVAALAARHGAHIVCEKPFALSLDALDALWQTVTSAGVQCIPILANRQHPVLAAACDAVRRGWIGNVTLLNARKSYRWGTRPAWFGRRETYGGTLPWIGIHALDFIHAAAGRPFVSISAVHARLGHPSHPECEDACAFCATLEGGAVATGSIDYFRPDCAPTHGDDWLRIAGTRGIIEAEMERGHCRILSPDVPRTAGNASAEPQFAELPLPPRAMFLEEPVRALAPRGTKADPCAETRRGFLLSQAALLARDAADSHAVLSIPRRPWHLT